jgi:hypothetical protein
VCIAGRARIPAAWVPRRYPSRPPAEGTPPPAEETPPPASVDFPAIAQYFVPEGEGRVLEEQVGEDLLARVAVNDRCEAVLLGLEPR